MGVDFYTCARCGENIPDCGYYVTCYSSHSTKRDWESRTWCSDRCASLDGFIRSEDDDEETSCSYCRKEKATDSDLLEYALDRLQTSRKQLEKEYLKGIIRLYERVK